ERGVHFGDGRFKADGGGVGIGTLDGVHPAVAFFSI
ncbi:hypothetical protein Tco_0587297, partial [Tanacetum coccineum]